MTYLTTPCALRQLKWAVAWIEAGNDPEEMRPHIESALATLGMPANADGYVELGEFEPECVPHWMGGPA